MITVKHVWKRRCPDIYEGMSKQSIRKWKCKRCGLERSNKVTHVHGVPLKD